MCPFSLWNTADGWMDIYCVVYLVNLLRLTFKTPKKSSLLSPPLCSSNVRVCFRTMRSVNTVRNTFLKSSLSILSRLLRFPLLRFPPLHFCYSRVFHSRVFSRPWPSLALCSELCYPDHISLCAWLLFLCGVQLIRCESLRHLFRLYV